MSNYFLLIFSIFLFNIQVAYTQGFEILNVKGTVVNNISFDTLEIGDKYEKTTDTLVCSDSTDLMLVLNNQNALFIVHPVQKDSVLLAIKYQSVPFKTKGRPGKITNSIVLINHINEHNDYLILGDSCFVELSPTAFPMNEDRFFYIRYNFNGEIINKRLSSKENNLTISKKSLFKATFYKNEKYGVDTIIQIPSSTIKEFEFRYYNQKEKEPISFYDPSQPDHLQQREFIPIRLVFLDDEILKEELDFIIPILKKSKLKLNSEELFDRVHAYLELRFDGKIEEKNLREWWNQN